MANVIISSTNDGFCGMGLRQWVDARNGAGNTSNNNASSAGTAVQQYYHSGRGTWLIYRAFFEFDTSTISTAPATASLFIRGRSTAEADLIVIRSEQSGTLASGDFNSFEASILAAFGNTNGSGGGDLTNIKGITYSKELTTWLTSTTFNEFVLNGTARADMARLDTFKLCVMTHDDDYKDEDGTDIERVGMYFADHPSSKPYVAYTPSTDAVFFGCNF